MDGGLIFAGPLLAGYALDLALGDPRWLPHPIVGYGKAIAWGERRWNYGGARARFWKGLALAVGLIGGAYGGAWALQTGAARWHPAAALGCATVGVFFALANRTLIAEGRGVFLALEESVAAGCPRCWPTRWSTRSTR